MSFTSGAVSFRTFSVVGQVPATPDQQLLDKIEGFAFSPSDLGVPDEVEYGWAGAKHLMDRDFSFGALVFDSAIYFALLVQTNKVPGDVKKAMLEKLKDVAAAGNPSGFCSKLQLRECKDTLTREVDDLLRAGKYKKERLVPVLWDLSSGTVYTAASGKAMDYLGEIFERTFGASLSARSAGPHAAALSHNWGLQGLDDARPTKFSALAPDGSTDFPDYPWVAKQIDPKAFLGNEFLRWLVYQDWQQNGRIPLTECTLYFDKQLVLECPFGIRGREQFRGDAPARSAECLASLAEGKVPRSATLVIDRAGYQFTVTLNPELMRFGSVMLPAVEDAQTTRDLFLARIDHIKLAVSAVSDVYNAFLRVRLSAKWAEVVEAIVAASVPVAAVAA